jgi:hypothetical protein
MTVVQDTFIRANQSGWGTASDGSTWAKLGGSTPTQAIASNEGTWTGVTASASYALSTNTWLDANVSMRLKISNTGDSVGIFCRSDGTAQNFYRAFAQNTTLTLSKTVAGVTTSLATTAITFNTGTFYWIRLRVIGNGLSARWWADGSSEPTNWTLTATDTAVSSSGRVGVRISLNATTDTASIDTFNGYQLTSLNLSTRFLLMSANQLKDVVTRFLLMSANQLKDVAARLRLMSANQLKDVIARFRLMSANQLKDIAARLRLKSTDQPKDVANRFRLRSADQLRDIVLRFRLMSANQLKDIAGRLRLMSASQLRDVNSRFVLRMPLLVAPYVVQVTFRDGEAMVTYRDGLVQTGGR